MKNVNQGIRKKDAMALLMGKPVYMDDLAPRDCLIVKVLRSPHANAMIQSVKTDAAMKVPGIAAVHTWADVSGAQPLRPADPGPACAVCGRSGGHCGRGDRGRRRPGLKAGEGAV